jgi:hypothetical protein
MRIPVFYIFTLKHWNVKFSEVEAHFSFMWRDTFFNLCKEKEQQISVRADYESGWR